MARQIAISIPSLDEEEWLALKGPIETGWLTQGPYVKEFEDNFCAAFDVRHALATTSCTTALHMGLLAAGVGSGDEVIVPSFSWISTANAVEYCGAKPVFIDVSPTTYNIDPTQIDRHLTERTKAIIPVHLFGYCADMDAIRHALPDDVFILEDAACAVGATYKGVYAGSLGDAACFSFHPRKLITTGEGGMVTTNDRPLFEHMASLRNHGASLPKENANPAKPYAFADYDMLGFNYRMTDLQAAVGIVQLKKLKQFIDERDQWATWYNEQLGDIEWLQLPRPAGDYVHAWQAYTVLVDDSAAPCSRNEIMDKLLQMGITTRPGTQAIHMMGYYRDKYRIHADDYPGAKLCYENSMALPLHNNMTKDDYTYVVECIRSIK